MRDMLFLVQMHYVVHLMSIYFSYCFLLLIYILGQVDKKIYKERSWHKVVLLNMQSLHVQQYELV